MARETGATGRSFSLATYSALACWLRCRLSMVHRFGAGVWRLVDLGRTRLRKVASLSPVSSFVRLSHVRRRCLVGLDWNVHRFSHMFGVSWFLRKGVLENTQLLSALSSHVVGEVCVLLFASAFLAEGKCGVAVGC